MKKIFNFIAPCLILLIVSDYSFAQCVMFPVSLQERVQQSEIVVEGKVVSSKSFWDNSHSSIYTASEIEVYKVFKGSSSQKKITVITEGGQVGNEMIIANPGIQLTMNEAGMFFIHKSNYSVSIASGNSINYELYASAQGAIVYDVTDRTAHAPFDQYHNIETELYPSILQFAGQTNFQNVKPVDFFQPKHGNNHMMPPTITSFSPSSTYAGTQGANLFTITGTNFGSSYVSGTSKLEFKNANDGGASYILTPDNHIQSWTNTTITAWIPTGAGSGTFRVTNNTSESVTSSTSVSINYNESNVLYSGAYYLPDLVNDNAAGGYTFVYNTTFNSNTAAVGAFERALSTWRCNTLVNFTRSGTTSIDVNASDGVNVITFDGASALPAGVLGTAYSYYSSCAAGVWDVSEIDLKLRTDGTGGITWNYGPAATTSGHTDLESVIVHELGHAHQLGHTNLTPPSVMHYAIGTATDRRTLVASSEIDGGNNIMTRSIVSNSCGSTAMTAISAGSCSLGAAPVADFTVSKTSLCKNDKINFTDLSSNTPTSWLWTFTGASPSTSTLQNPTGIKYATTGTFSVTLTATNAAGSDAETKTSYLKVNAAATATITATGPTTFCPGDSVILKANTGIGYTYVWKKGSKNVTGATSSSYTAKATATYKVVVTTSSGCSKTSAGVSVTASCKNYDELVSDFNFNVHPNPSSSTFTIDFNGNADGNISLKIFDLTGRIIEQEELGNQITQFSSGDNLIPGVYFIQLRRDNSEKVVKWIKTQ